MTAQNGSCGLIVWLFCRWPEGVDGYQVYGVFESAKAAMWYAYRNHELSQEWVPVVENDSARSYDHPQHEGWSIEAKRVSDGSEINPGSRFDHDQPAPGPAEGGEG